LRRKQALHGCETLGGNVKSEIASSRTPCAGLLIRVNIFVTSMSAERYWDIERPFPQQVQIGVNINMLDFTQQSDGTLDAPFVITINYAPSIAQISIKGKAKIAGEAEETKKIMEEHKAQKTPVQIVQAVSNAAMADAILISRSLNIPPPLPPISQGQGQPAAPSKPDTRYTA
jgi:hypothetical protein